MRSFTEFRHREAAFLVSSPAFTIVREEVRRCRRLLGDYIRTLPRFLEALEPLPDLPGDPPEIAVRMHAASLATGVGPMAAVAGATAQMAVEAALAAGLPEALVNNGGDVYLALAEEALVGLYGGEQILQGAAAFRIPAGETPLALCSSSSRMGHSRSLGRCDLATVCAVDGALADAAATLAGNLAVDSGRLAEAAERTAAVEGVRGVLIVMEGKVALAGSMPELVPARDGGVASRVLRHPGYRG